MNETFDFIDGYVFYEKRSSWLNVCKLWQEGVVRFAAKNLTGPDEVVAFVGERRGQNDHAKLQDKMRRAEEAANPSFSSATSTLITVSAPSRWSPKQPYAAHLRITADAGMARTVYDALDPTGPSPVFRRGHGYNGHALCEGKWDVLLELGADTADELDGLIAVARGVPNIRSMIVTTLRMEPSQPRPPDVCEPWT